MTSFLQTPVHMALRTWVQLRPGWVCVTVKSARAVDRRSGPSYC